MLKYCPKCQKYIDSPSATETTKYAQYWRDDQCYYCSTKLRTFDHNNLNPGTPVNIIPASVIQIILSIHVDELTLENIYSNVEKEYKNMGLFIVNVSRISKHEMSKRSISYMLLQSYLLFKIYTTYYKKQCICFERDFIDYFTEITSVSANCGGDLDKTYIPTIQPNLFNYIMVSCRDYKNRYNISTLEIGVVTTAILSVMLVLDKYNK